MRNIKIKAGDRITILINAPSVPKDCESCGATAVIDTNLHDFIEAMKELTDAKTVGDPDFF